MANNPAMLQDINDKQDQTVAVQTTRLQNEPVQTFTAETGGTLNTPHLHGNVFHGPVNINIGTAYGEKSEEATGQSVEDSCTAAHTGDSEFELKKYKTSEEGYRRLIPANTNYRKAQLEHGVEDRIKPEFKNYACDFTLDPNTAHRYLSLSDGNRKVVNLWRTQSPPEHPERFDYYAQVLSRECVTGRCYWEAEWSGREADIAVTYKSISRKGNSYDCVLGRYEKSWAVECFSNRYSVRHNNIRTELSTPPSGCKRVGVYVDCPAGTVSFYRVSSDQHTLTHLHTFYSSFTEPLYSGFWVGRDSSVCLYEVK